MKPYFQIIVFLFFCGNITAQQTEYVDFKTAKVVLDVDVDKSAIKGYVTYAFDVLAKTDSIFIDAKKMKIESVKLNGIEVEYLYDDRKIRINKNFEISTENVLFIRYSAKPDKAMYFIGNQVWTQGQGKYTSNWLPSIDDVNDKIEFDLSITYNNGYEVLTNGKLVEKDISDKYTTWHYDMEKPMSSYLVALSIGKYDKKTELSKTGIPLEYYYYPEDSLNVEPTYRYTKQMFDFLEDEIGYPYPWQNYKQVPVKDFLYSGMENTSLTIFSDSFVVDSIGFNDRNYITVNAHELAHQWFGNLVTAKSGDHHWLQEGFATYYALLAERTIFGDNHYYWQLFENAQELIAQEEAGQSTSLLNPKSSSTTFYKKGAWALHILRERVGDSAFQNAVRIYLEKHQFDNVETNDFITEVEQTSGEDLTDFVNEWLLQVELPEDVIVKSLKRSTFMQEYLSIDCNLDNSKCSKKLSSNSSDKAKVKIISQIPNQIDASAFQNALEVRQAISRYVEVIPPALKLQYESLLNDKSYLTIESALYHLWVNFPEERAKYLQKTKNIKGFTDYNVRLLWLALHLNTAEYQPEKKQQVLDELIRYSLPGEHFELRMNAFNYLKLLGGFEEKSIRSLIEATKHHNWRFSKYAKDVLIALEKETVYKSVIEQLKNE